jgi:predicted nuclease of predicted toxin-antitoxin system
VKLLFDQNLSPRLATRLQDLFPNSSHVFWVGLDQAEDVEVWEYARQNGYLVVTKDVDFSELSTLQGFPPKVIWLQLGNCTTGQVERLLRLHYEAIRQLTESESIGILSLV